MDGPICFNPRPCTRGDHHTLIPHTAFQCVSIHAPARGATTLNPTIRKTAQVSIHAPARGATSDLFTLCADCEVSIHAPARGATAPAMRIVTGPVKFQSTPLHEGRRGMTRAAGPITVFQSTPLHEGRPPVETAGPAQVGCFNPRPCTRGDFCGSAFSSGGRGFNPRPCTRGDLRRLVSRQHREVSIHAPARGATFVPFHGILAVQVSIHAPARGATRSRP